MATNGNIAQWARGYGSFHAVERPKDQEQWYEDTNRAANRKVLDDRRKAVLAFPAFCDAVTLLRHITVHAKPFLLGAIRTERLRKGQKIAGDHCVTYILEGQAAVLDSGGSVHELYEVGQLHGEETLLGLAVSPLHATSTSLLVLRLAKDELQGLRKADPTNFDRFEAQMRLHRAWYFGDAPDGGNALSSVDVQELAKSLRSFARKDEANTIRRLLFGKEHLAAIGDPTVSALHFLCHFEACGAIPDVRDCSSRTPLHSAALLGDVKAVQVLSEAKCNMNLSNKKFQTALHVAAQEGHAETLSCLLKCGAAIDVQDIRQNTAVHLAVANGWSECVKILLLAGADVMKKNEHARNVWHEAQHQRPIHGVKFAGRVRDQSAEIGSLVHQVFVRERHLSEQVSPARQRDRSYLHDLPPAWPAPGPGSSEGASRSPDDMDATPRSASTSRSHRSPRFQLI